MRVVESHEISKKKPINHSFIIHVISNHENSFFRSMSMKVTKEICFFLLMKIDKKLFTCIDGWLVFRVWAFVQSVQIISLSVNTIVSSIDSIWVEHWDHNEHKVVT